MGWRSVLGLKEKPEGVTFDPPSHLAANTDPVKPASSAYRAEKKPLTPQQVAAFYKQLYTEARKELAKSLKIKEEEDVPAEAISDRVKELIEDKYPEHKEAIEAFMKALLEKDKQKEIPLERDTEDRERDKRLLERQSREFGEKIKRPLETLLGKIKPYIDSTYDERSYPIDGDVIKKEMVAILRRENNVTHPIRADEPVATVSKSEAPLDQGIQFSPEAGMYKIAEEEVPAKPAAPAHQETMDLDGRSGLLKSFDQLPAMADDPSKLAALRASFRQVYAFMSVKAIDDAALKSDDNYTSRHLAEIAGMMKLIDDAFDSPQFKKSENAYHELGKVEAAGKNVDRGVKKRELLDHATRSAERDLGLKL